MYAHPFQFTMYLYEVCKGKWKLLGNLEQYSAYQCWCQTTYERAYYYEEALEMFGLLDDPDVPKEGRHQELHQSHKKRKTKLQF